MLFNKAELGGERGLKPGTVAFMPQNLIGDTRGVLGGDGCGFSDGGTVVIKGPSATAAQPHGAFSHFSTEGT